MDFRDKFGLIVGVANKRSIAWAIAQATASRGARLALTYQGRFEEHVHELGHGLDQAPLVLPCDVTSDEEMAAVFAKLDAEFGGLDFVVHGAAFAPRARCPRAMTIRRRPAVPGTRTATASCWARARASWCLKNMSMRGAAARASTASWPATA